MDFVPQPEDTKKFGTIRWLKWNIYKYPNIFLIALPVPFIIYKATQKILSYNRDFNNGTYVPYVIMNRYAVCREDDWLVKNTPKRYLN